MKIFALLQFCYFPCRLSHFFIRILLMTKNSLIFAMRHTSELQIFCISSYKLMYCISAYKSIVYDCSSEFCPSTLNAVPDDIVSMGLHLKQWCFDQTNLSQLILHGFCYSSCSVKKKVGGENGGDGEQRASYRHHCPPLPPVTSHTFVSDRTTACDFQDNFWALSNFKRSCDLSLE